MKVKKNTKVTKDKDGMLDQILESLFLLRDLHITENSSEFHAALFILFGERIMSFSQQNKITIDKAFEHFVKEMWRGVEHIRDLTTCECCKEKLANKEIE